MPRAAKFGDWLALLALTAMWGSAFMFNEYALAAFPPAVLVAGRLLIATALLVAFMRANGVRLPAFGRAWIPIAVMALLGNVLPFQLIAWGQQYIDSSLAGILMAVMPLFVLTLAHFFLPGSTLTPYRVAGFVIGFSGVVAVIGPEALGGLSNNTALWGAIAALGAALSYSINSIYARRLGAADPIQLSAGTLVAASLMTLPVASVDLSSVATPGPAAIVAMLVLGLLSTGLATLIYFRLVQGPGPAFISTVNYLVPVWAVGAGALFLGESISPRMYGGMLLILSGIALGELGPRVASLLHDWRSALVRNRIAREKV
ncbi:MAG: DMT family transporter [Gammaproteobacteria bacterium]|nr:DMT family transporter [Gammaproteobacteria bacterium]